MAFNRRGFSIHYGDEVTRNDIVCVRPHIKNGPRVITFIGYTLTARTHMPAYTLLLPYDTMRVHTHTHVSQPPREVFITYTLNI